MPFTVIDHPSLPQTEGLPGKWDYRQAHKDDLVILVLCQAQSHRRELQPDAPGELWSVRYAPELSQAEASKVGFHPLKQALVKGNEERCDGKSPGTSSRKSSQAARGPSSEEELQVLVVKSTIKCREGAREQKLSKGIILTVRDRALALSAAFP